MNHVGGGATFFVGLVGVVFRKAGDLSGKGMGWLDFVFFWMVIC